MDQHRTLRMRPETTRAERRRAAQRKKFLERLFVSFALAGTALVLVVLFGQQPEPPLVEATLPDRPEPEEPVVNDEGFLLDRESVLAPVASGRPVNGAESVAERLSRPGEGGRTGQSPPPFSAIPPDPPVPSGTPVGDRKLSPAPIEDDIDDEPPPPPVTTEPPIAVDEEGSRPPIDLPADAVCWPGWTYDEGERQCVRVEEEPEPADKAEDAEEVAEEETEEPSRGLGGVGKDGEVSR